MRWKILQFVVSIFVASIVSGEEPASFARLGREYDAEIRPLLQKFCLDCHATALKEGELDLERFASLAQVRRDPRTWQNVERMLDTGEMPPEDSEQLGEEQQGRLREWLGAYLWAEADANAGDPGPVVLRRLNNAEYTYTICDLTGVELDPAREFPADGAAGEGFSNTGAALAMSPALVEKYLAAGKDIAAHAVLLPDGFRFSPSTTRRDWADEILTEIRLIYARHTSGESETSILDRWTDDPRKSTENDGRVDLTRYFDALIRHHDDLLEHHITPEAVAREVGLSVKYIECLAEMLLGDQAGSMLLSQIQRRWRAAKPDDAAALAGLVRAWQDPLWKFNVVGHLGMVQPWQEPNNPLPASVTLRQPIAPGADQEQTALFLLVGDAGDGNDDDVVICRRPRIEFKDRPPLLLRDVRGLTGRIQAAMGAELKRTDLYLSALASRQDSTMKIEELAREKQLDTQLLAAWSEYLELGRRHRPMITGHFATKLFQVGGYETVNGWAAGDLPSALANRADTPASITTLIVPPRAVTLHPTPTQEAVVGWQSPVDMRCRVTGKVADADDKCGNGAAWRLECRSAAGTAALAEGVIDNGRDASLKPDAVLDIRQGDVISLAIGPRDNDHTCDTTHVELKVQEVGERERIWDLATQVVDRIATGNPLPDTLGHTDTWHFFARDVQATTQDAIPPGSALARWRRAVTDSRPQEQLSDLAAAVRDLLIAHDDRSLAAPDQQLWQTLRDWQGPLPWGEVARQPNQEAVDGIQPHEDAFGLDPKSFGRHPAGREVGIADLVVRAPQALKIRLPGALAAGGELVIDAAIDPDADGHASVQVQLLTENDHASAGLMGPQELLPGVPILTLESSPARERVIHAYDDFRRLFPAAMCHARIVPVDEVVTLVLYHREDEHLARLMLDEEEQARLDRLWDQLRFVSRDAFRMEVALEQILEFATQDADPRRFDPVRKPIADFAEALRRQLAESERAHVDNLVDFASYAYRRPLRDDEGQRLRDLYRRLRDEGLPHEEAVRTTMARILSSPNFLYRLEQPGEGSEPTPVSDWELASRLSYLLWSSAPDHELRSLAESGELSDPDTLARQARRMLQGERTRRLAIEFGCQWLHVRDFDQLDEKSERHFPQFTALRDEMYEETIRFLEDLFRRDGSILELVNADHTFLNESLAAHYGVPGVSGTDWRRVDGVQQFGRGGILTFASTLSKQSGASRTSPILRGNWLAETLLGERTPRPPKNVPQLPEDEADLDGLTMRQIVERHTSDPACAKCHLRIDPYGFALEQFDAIGRRRERDLGGQPIDTKTKLMDGTEVDGAAGLREYLLNSRRDAFLRQFCRKLLGYALGRSVQLSDEPLLEAMLDQLAANEYRFSVAVETIVLSPQFRMIRGANP